MTVMQGHGLLGEQLNDVTSSHGELYRPSGRIPDGARRMCAYPPSGEVISGSFFRRKRNQLFQVFRILSRGVR
jgi:hypothetical protein